MAPAMHLHPALAPDRLAHLWSLLEPVLPGVLERFYTYYQNIPVAAEKLKGADINRLKAAQTAHWKATCLEGINDAYFTRCTRIGMAHAKIGLDQHAYCTAYGMVIHFVRDALIGDANWVWGWAPWRTPRLKALESLYQLVVIDIATSTSAYALALENTSWERISTICSGLTTATAETTRRIQDSSVSVETAKVGSTEASDKLDALVRQSHAIYDILKLIRDVAEQTNLLSLNARIEAARAGDAGRGFSVVAEEVKKLSVRVQKATVDIAAQIEAMTQMAAEANGAMRSVADHIGQVGASMSSVTHAFTEQQTAITYIQDRGHDRGLGEDRAPDA